MSLNFLSLQGIGRESLLPGVGEARGLINGSYLGTKDLLSPAQGRCPPHPKDLLGQPLDNEGRVRGTAPWASVGRSQPTGRPEGTLGSVALETRALWRSCWLEKKLAATRLPPSPSPRHINPAVPRVQPGWSAYENLLQSISCTVPASSLGILGSQSHSKL